MWKRIRKINIVEADKKPLIEEQLPPPPPPPTPTELPKPADFTAIRKRKQPNV